MNYRHGERMKMCEWWVRFVQEITEFRISIFSTSSIPMSLAICGVYLNAVCECLRALVFIYVCMYVCIYLYFLLSLSLSISVTPGFFLNYIHLQCFPPSLYRYELFSTCATLLFAPHLCRQAKDGVVALWRMDNGSGMIEEYRRNMGGLSFCKLDVGRYEGKKV